MKNKVQSFTLSELLIVMVITAIIVGMAFSVLRLVQKQIHMIRKNFDKTANLALFEERLCRDFNEFGQIEFHANEKYLTMKSEIDTVHYSFSENYVLRNTDTLNVRLSLGKAFLDGKEVRQGVIDAITIAGEADLPDYAIFVSRKNDITFYMNQEDGF